MWWMLRSTSMNQRHQEKSGGGKWSLQVWMGMSLWKEEGPRTQVGVRRGRALRERGAAGNGSIVRSKLIPINWSLSSILWPPFKQSCEPIATRAGRPITYGPNKPAWLSNKPTRYWAHPVWKDLRPRPWGWQPQKVPMVAEGSHGLLTGKQPGMAAVEGRMPVLCDVDETRYRSVLDH